MARNVIAYCGPWNVLDFDGVLYLEGPRCFAPLQAAIDAMR